MIGQLKTVVLDAADFGRLAAFYSGLAGWTQVGREDDWISLSTEDGWRIGIQHAPDHQPPRWPDPAYPQQAHLDLKVPDLDAATARAIELGATRLGGGETWHTLADPAGHPFDLCLNAGNPKTTLMGVMLDCPDAKVLSHFYADLLGKPITYEAEGMAMIGNEGERPVLFQQVPVYTAPRWPDPAHPQQMHLDVLVDEIETAERGALGLGATRLDGGGDNWRVYADPAGKPFCLIWHTQ